MLFWPGDTATDAATVTDPSGSELANPDLTWSSSQVGVATVSDSGLVTAVAYGSAAISVEATSGGQTATQTLSVTVDSTNLLVTTTSLPDVVANVLYDEMLTATGGVGPYSWTLALGSSPLAPGLGLIANGNITGVPTGVGTVLFRNSNEAFKLHLGSSGLGSQPTARLSFGTGRRRSAVAPPASRCVS